MGASRPPLTRWGGTGLSAPIFFALASQRKKGFPLQSLARKAAPGVRAIALNYRVPYFTVSRILARSSLSL
jgi:hypothetical protein